MRNPVGLALLVVCIAGCFDKGGSDVDYSFSQDLSAPAGGSASAAFEFALGKDTTSVGLDAEWKKEGDFTIFFCSDPDSAKCSSSTYHTVTNKKRTGIPTEIYHLLEPNDGGLAKLEFSTNQNARFRVDVYLLTNSKPTP